MSGGAVLFRAGAFVALLLLVRHAVVKYGRREGTALVLYLAVIGAVREWAVSRISHAIEQPVPYTADAKLGHLGAINLVVVAGWMFTTLLSFQMAMALQRRNFPRTNVFLTLSLTALVTTAISYAVEVTGMRLGLWRWRQPHAVPWLPFDWPFDAFEGWAATSFMIMLVYCGVRYRLFASRRWASALVVAGLVALFALADLAQPWLGPDSPRKKVTLVYLVAATILGFRAPSHWLGSSAKALRT